MIGGNTLTATEGNYISQTMDLTGATHIHFYAAAYSSGTLGVIIYLDDHCLFSNGYMTKNSQWNEYSSIEIPADHRTTGQVVKIGPYWSNGNTNGFVDQFHLYSEIPATTNVSFNLYEYNGNYSTSPKINGTVTLNDVLYQVNDTGSSYTLDTADYTIFAQSPGYDNITTSRILNGTPITVDLYMLKQNNIIVSYEALDSVTLGLVPDPTVELYDTVTGTRTQWTEARAAVPVMKDHLVYFNASSPGYGDCNRSYTFTGNTKFELILQSPEVAPEGKAFVTFRTAIDYIVAIPGVSISIDGRSITTDESGLATVTLNDTGTYAWTATKTGYYPVNDLYTMGTIQGNIIDVSMTARITTGPTPEPEEVDTTVIDGYKDLVDGAVGTVTGIITGGIDLIVAPVNILNGSVTTINTTVSEGMGFAGNSTSVFTDLFGIIIFGLPWQVKGLITYYLAWLLALMFLNR